jgi:pyrimidine operon attenuation protein/uracil phosphoribosyltransferase
MSEKKLLILNQQQIQQKLDRIAYQILEDNFDEEEIMIAGILPRGNHIAKR